MPRSISNGTTRHVSFASFVHHLRPAALGAVLIGNAQPAQRDFRAAIALQRQLIAAYPDSQKAGRAQHRDRRSRSAESAAERLKRSLRNTCSPTRGREGTRPPLAEVSPGGRRDATSFAARPRGSARTTPRPAVAGHADPIITTGDHVQQTQATVARTTRGSSPADVAALAVAPPGSRALSGLGYYRRAHHLHRGAASSRNPARPTGSAASRHGWRRPPDAAAIALGRHRAGADPRRQRSVLGATAASTAGRARRRSKPRCGATPKRCCRGAARANTRRG
jgi:type VI secretion system protein ImpB